MRRRKSRDPTMLMEFHNQMKRNEQKIKIIELFNNGINNDRNYHFVMKKVNDFLKYRAPEMRKIWSYIPIKVEDILTKEMKKRALKHNEFMREKFLKYLKSVLDKAEKEMIKPEDHDSDSEDSLIKEMNDNPQYFIGKHRFLTSQLKLVDNELIQRMDKFRLIDAQEMNCSKDIARLCIKAIKNNDSLEVKRMLELFPELIKYRDCVILKKLIFSIG